VVGPVRSREGRRYVQVVLGNDTISLSGVPVDETDELKLNVREIVAATNGDD
jgi:hypothetical protein